MAFGEMVAKHLYECPHCNFRGYVVSQYFVSEYETDEEMMICCEGCERIIWISIDELMKNEVTIRRFDWFFNNYFGIGIRWDICIYLLLYRS